MRIEIVLSLEWISTDYRQQCSVNHIWNYIFVGIGRTVHEIGLGFWFLGKPNLDPQGREFLNVRYEVCSRVCVEQVCDHQICTSYLRAYGTATTKSEGNIVDVNLRYICSPGYSPHGLFVLRRNSERRVLALWVRSCGDWGKSMKMTMKKNCFISEGRQRKHPHGFLRISEQVCDIYIRNISSCDGSRGRTHKHKWKTSHLQLTIAIWWPTQALKRGGKNEIEKSWWKFWTKKCRNFEFCAAICAMRAFIVQIAEYPFSICKDSMPKISVVACLRQELAKSNRDDSKTGQAYEEQLLIYVPDRWLHLIAT